MRGGGGGGFKEGVFSRRLVLLMRKRTRGKVGGVVCFKPVCYARGDTED